MCFVVIKFRGSIDTFIAEMLRAKTALETADPGAKISDGILGYVALRASMDTRQKAARAGAILAMVGAINVPLIKFSVDMVESIHQGASVITADGPKMAAVYLTPLLISGLGHSLFFGGLVMTSMRTEIRERRIARLRAASLEGA